MAIYLAYDGGVVMADASKFVEISNNDDQLLMAKKINANFKKLLDGSASQVRQFQSFTADISNSQSVADEAAILAEAARIRAEEAQSLANEIAVAHKFTVQVISSHGNIFKNSEGTTTLTAVLYDWDVDVTSLYDRTCFKWERVSADAAGDIAWNQEHYSGAKSISVSSVDVDNLATFTCSFTDPLA